MSILTLLAAHTAITAFDNLPDASVSIGTRLPLVKKIPQWRFFAPNPGVEDLHVMFRTSSSLGWTRWEELPFRSTSRFYSMFWNPESRQSKALFDIAHQIRVLAGYESSLEWIIESDGFLLMKSFVANECSRRGRIGDFQFMILTSTPNDVDSIKPIFVSPVALIPEPITEVAKRGF